VRLFWASLLFSCGAAAATKDLAPYFAGRGGSALLWDLEKGELAGAWNEARAGTVEVRPGSLRKPFVFAAMLEEGVYAPEDTVKCREGMLNGTQALAYSCNEYFDAAAKRVDLTRGLARFGWDAGRPTMKLRDLLAAWRRLVARNREARLAPVFQGMREAVEYGTARLAGMPGVAVAGKTGTMRETALFAGFAPAEKPRYLLLIHVAGGSGGSDAAPYAGKIFRDLFAGPRREFDPTKVRVRLFWQAEPRDLNLKPGVYGRGTEIRVGGSRMKAPGRIEVKGNTIEAEVALEEYVEAVLHGEAGGFRHAESRKAMAVAARTYAARFRGRHAEEGFDFCDTTHCQDARFVDAPRSDLRDATEETSGELIWWQGRPAAAYYHADSGGWIEGAGDGPYLRTRRDAWWKDEAGASWTWNVKAAELAERLGLKLVRREIRVKEREDSGRVKKIDAFGRTAEGTAFRMAVGRTMGWEKLPSRLFEVRQEGQRLAFTGKGRGHGIGLAQTSAERMAAAGKNYREILREYYPGTAVGVTARGFSWESRQQDGVILFSTEMAKDGRWMAVAAKEWGTMQREFGMRGEAVLRIYPTREAFRDATGITDQVAGATRGKRVRLVAGFSAGTLRHELLHALLETNTSTAHPLWFREGMVQALNGESGADGLRVQGLLRRHGRERVLGFWRQGLPADEVQQ
jgi:stage II sporulation protein D